MKKKDRPQTKDAKGGRKKAPEKSPPRVRVKEGYILAVIFLLAFSVRLACLIQFDRAPNFDNPIGDSNEYYQRSLAILEGDIIGQEIYFHSSPPYPYFMALIFAISGGSFFVLRLVQILIGSANCVLICLLTKRLAPSSRAAPALAGILAALYGVLAFFDLDLLMIFMTLFLVDACLLLLIRARESGGPATTFLAGALLGLAALDKTNLLVFAPLAAWYLAGDFSLNFMQWKWSRGFILAAGVVLMILPVTIRNYAVGDDFVLVSSNAGVNLFIGNNHEGRGIFLLPPSSGLRNTDLPGTSIEVAEKALGRSLKPSEVSGFWAEKAWEFILRNPLEALKLIGLKAVLLLGSFEIPNHLNFYFMRQDYVGAYKFLPAGFWLVVPLGLVGIFWRRQTGFTGPDRLLAGFLVAYTISILPFFITSRYRLPMIPVLIVFASAALVDWISRARELGPRKLAPWALALILVFAFVNRPQTSFSYGFNRVVMANKYLERSLKDKDGDQGRMDAVRAIVEFKRALETDPLSTDAHYNLGRAYEMVGFYSGAAREWEETLKIDPGIEFAAGAIESVRPKLASGGDRIPADAIPKTPYETAVIEESRGNGALALDMYGRIIRDDPYHFMAMNNMAYHYYQRGDLKKAVKYFEKGLAIKPDHFFMLNNLAGAYYKLGEKEKAEELWQKCLAIQPDSELILNQLKMVL